MNHYRPLRLAIITSLLLIATAFATLSAMGQSLDADSSMPRHDTLRLVESFDEDLAITDRRIERENLHADVAVGIGGAGEPIEVTVGAAVDAERVVITMRNVFGHVGFRASLERIVDVINARRPAVR